MDLTRVGGSIADDRPITAGAKAAAMHNARNHEILKTISLVYLLGTPGGSPSEKAILVCAIRMARFARDAANDPRDPPGSIDSAHW
jgi:hypothetical protein